MGRSTQIIGLSDSAREWLVNNVDTVTNKCSCPDCKTDHIQSWVREEYSDASGVGMFDDGPMLNKYKLKDGSWVYEYVQAVPWSSGPCIFLALCRDRNELNRIEESLWPEETMASF